MRESFCGRFGLFLGKALLPSAGYLLITPLQEVLKVGIERAKRRVRRRRLGGAGQPSGNLPQDLLAPNRVGFNHEVTEHSLGYLQLRFQVATPFTFGPLLL